VSVNVFQRPWPKALIVSLVLTTVSAACGSGGAASRPASEIHASPKDQAKLQRIAAVLRRNGFAVRVAGPSDTVAVRLGAEQGLVGLVVSADADDVREKGVVIWALFARAQDAQRYYQALQEWAVLSHQR
jgi:hypothetical protein